MKEPPFTPPPSKNKTMRQKIMIPKERLADF